MPVNREPLVYPGYVISKMGNNAGEQEEMPYKVAQGCVSSGTHRWHDDETDMPVHVQAIIDDRAKTQAEIDEANAKHNAEMRAQREASESKSVDELLASKARPIYFASVDDKTYLARPFPDLAVFDASIERADGKIFIVASNALAEYKVVSETETSVIAELVSAELPDVDIPDDWRDKNALQLAALGKKVRATSDKMKAEEARAILEEWTKQDDPVSAEIGNEGGEGAGEQKGTDAVNEFKDKDGNQISPEQRAKEAEQEFLHNDE